MPDDRTPPAPASDEVRAALGGFGARPDAAPPPPPGRHRRLLVAATALAALALAGLAAALVADRRDRDARERAELREAVAARRALLTRIQAPRAGSAPELRAPRGASAARRLAARAALVRAVEAAITTDARRRASAGELDGPIARTECGPIARRPDAVPDDRDLRRRIGRYDCVAVKGDVRQGGRSVGRLGHPFVAALDFDRFTWVTCRNTPPQSERGQVLVSVRLDRRCLAATGRALGTGYVDEPAP